MIQKKENGDGYSSAGRKNSFNDRVVPISYFAASILVFSLITVSSYGNAFCNRRSRKLARLYHDFYPNNPQFVNRLISFLESFAEDNLKEVTLMTTFSGMLFAAIYIWPIEMWEFAFPGVCIVTLIIREMMASFQVVLEQDILLMSYFTKRRNL